MLFGLNFAKKKKRKKNDQSPMDNFCCQAHSFKRSFIFLFLFVVFILVLLGSIALITVFVVKPKSPVFSLQTAKLNLYKLNSNLGSSLSVSSVITLTLNAQNPSKVGIRYSPSRFRVYSLGLPIGTIRVPGFVQPAHSHNMTVPTRVLVQCVDVSRVLGEALSQGDSKNVIRMKVLGDVKAHLLAFHLTLLTVKVSLECDMNIDVKVISRNNELFSIVKNHMASLLTNPRTMTRKCSLSFYI